MLKRILLALLATKLIVAAVFVGPLVWGRPWFIDHFYTRVFVAFLLRHPMVATSVGMDVPFAADRLDDLSPGFERREAAWVRRQLDVLRQYDARRMNASQRLSRDVMEYFLEDVVQGQRFPLYDYTVNGFQGVQGALPEFLLTIHPMKRARDARRYVRRVERLGTALDQVTEGVRDRAARGIVAPRFVLAAVVTEIDSLIAPAPRAHPLYRRIDAAVDTLRGIDGERSRRRMRDRVARALAERVVPAYRRLRGVCDSLATVASDDDGVWKLPNGDAYYAWQLRHHTTTDLPADSIHTLGLSEVARIQAAIAALLRRVGHPGGLRAGLDALEQDDRFHFTAGEGARDSILATYRALLRDAEARLPELFGIRPKARLEVARVPTFREAGSAAAYYMAPAMDGSRGGTFYVNARDPRETARFDMRTLAYHEGLPGHHLQQAIASEATGLPFFRRVIPFTAYDEGWALYAERLALEQGFHPTAYDSIGSLRADLLRATRLVVDTGLHRKRWTREQAVRYMVDEGLQTESLARTEVDRYIVNPGQACAYKVGQLKILELRRRAMDRLGSRFDLRRFHDVVLENGALPLVLLERQVDAWIAREAGPGAGS